MYINQEDRKIFDDIFCVLASFEKCRDSGHVLHLLKYIISLYYTKTPKTFQDINDVLGAITTSYLEVSRLFKIETKLHSLKSDKIQEVISPLCIEIFETVRDNNLIKSAEELCYFITKVMITHMKQIENSLTKIAVHRDTAIKNELSFIYSALLFDFYNYCADFMDARLKENGDI